MRSLVVLLLPLSLGCAKKEPFECIAPEPADREGAAPAVAAPEVQRSISAPPPIDVCRHVRDVASRSETSAERLVAMERDCVATLERVQQTYDTLASCLFNAAEDAQIGACEDTMRRWTDQLDGFSPEPTYVAVCDHVMEVMKREFGDSATQPSDSEMAKFTQKCVEDLDKERARIGAGEFREQVTCVMAATTLDRLMACDKEAPTQ